MIYDNIASLKKYKGINKNFDCVIDYIERNGLDELKTGKNLLDGDKVYASVMTCSLLEEQSETYEVHRKYADLHIDIEGQEYICLSECQRNLVTNSYVENDDYELQKGEWTIKCKLNPDYFLLCLPGEAHAPILGKKCANDVVKKVVIKILWNNN